MEKGCRNIVYVDRISARGHVSPADDMRFSGFVDEMKESGFSVGPDNIVCGCRSQEELEEELRERFRKGKAADGIFGRNDTLACIAMTTAQQVGLRVPEDIRIIGFDDSSISRLCSPKLSTLGFQQREIAKTAIDMLSQMMNGQQPENVDFDTVLIERESTL